MPEINITDGELKSGKESMVLGYGDLLITAACYFNTTRNRFDKHEPVSGNVKMFTASGKNNLLYTGPATD